MLLHVTNGDSAAARLQDALAADVLPWRDVLHDGPVPAEPPEQLRRTRAAYLASRGSASEAELLTALEARDAAVLGADRVRLWFEHDLYDQLQLLQVLDLVGERDAVEAVVTDRFLTDFTPEALRAQLAIPVGPDVVAQARTAWTAFTGDDPCALARLERLGGILRHVEPALRNLLEELPWTTDGLGRWERALLVALSGGSLHRRSVYERAARAETAHFPADASAWALLDALGPLVERQESRYALTEVGVAVLQGEADRVEVAGIDRWIGGTRVRSPGAVWRWDPVFPGGGRVCPPGRAD